MTLKSVFGSTSPAASLNALDVAKSLLPYAVGLLAFVAAHATIPGHPIASYAVVGLAGLGANLIHLYLGDLTAK